MGNYVSCSLAGPAGKLSRGVKVILPSGEIRRFYEPVKAAELMLETPGYFVNNAKSLQIGRRFSALNADEDLEMANVYVMFPMRKVNSVVTAADMGALFITAKSAVKRASFAVKRASFGRMRISPESEGDDSLETMKARPVGNLEATLPKLNLDDFEEFSAPEFKQRLSLSRSKKPALETIVEESNFFRW